MREQGAQQTRSIPLINDVNVAWRTSPSVEHHTHQLERQLCHNPEHRYIVVLKHQWCWYRNRYGKEVRHIGQILTVSTWKSRECWRVAIHMRHDRQPRLDNSFQSDESFVDSSTKSPLILLLSASTRGFSPIWSHAKSRRHQSNDPQTFEPPVHVTIPTVLFEFQLIMHIDLHHSSSYSSYSFQRDWQIDPLKTLFAYSSQRSQTEAMSVQWLVRLSVSLVADTRLCYNHYMMGVNCSENNRRVSSWQWSKLLSSWLSFTSKTSDFRTGLHPLFDNSSADDCMFHMPCSLVGSR